MNSAPVMALQPVGAEHAGYWVAFPMSSPTLVETVCSPNAKGGELSASIDDAPIKVRKPYTITKQRERWTEDEHQKFLDALKLHGRAWRRIEEHIGTKTAVQIRSHAQKFFSKLEREASLGGSLATTGSGEIEIPPPRPKRKPSHPYPKKASGAFSSSPSFEEDCKSPPAVHSAFTPLESGTATTISKMPPKRIGSSAASLRLFGQNVVPGNDKVGADTDLMESTGSPRSQISVGTEETSGVSQLVSNTASGVWDQTASASKPNEAADPLSDTNSQLCNAFAEWEKSLTAIHAPPDGSCLTSWQPSSFALGGHHLAQLSASVPAFWQGFVPPNFAHGMNEDVNTAVAIAAATYAVASAWQAIQGALTNASNDSNTSIVYSPIAMLAAAREPVSVSRPQMLHVPPKRDQGGYCPGSGNEDVGASLHGEESTAECCSSLTDTSRLSSYESNDEGVPVKKRRRSFCEDNMQMNREALESLEILIRERISKANRPSVSSECYAILDESLHESNGTVAIHLRSTDDCMDGPSDEARPEKRSVNELQPEKDLHTVKIVSSNVSMDSDQPIDLIIQACGLDSPFETEECSSKESEDVNDSHDSDKEIVSSSTVSQLEANKASIPKECINRSLHSEWNECNQLQIGVNGTCTESSEHVWAGAILSSRYSGVGFVPYKKLIQIESSSKH